MAGRIKSAAPFPPESLSILRRVMENAFDLGFISLDSVEDPEMSPDSYLEAMNDMAFAWTETKREARDDHELVAVWDAFMAQVATQIKDGLAG
jgi:hypothetical protein